MDFLFSADIVVVFCPVAYSLDYIFRLVLQYLILNIGGRGVCVKPHDDITTVDVFPSLRPAASQMLCNEHHTAAMQSCKCHVLFMTLLHKEVNFAFEANNKYCSFFILDQLESLMTNQASCVSKHWCSFTAFRNRNIEEIY